jgi:hypothetical protein
MQSINRLGLKRVLIVATLALSSCNSSGTPASGSSQASVGSSSAPAAQTALQIKSDAAVKAAVASHTQSFLAGQLNLAQGKSISLGGTLSLSMQTDGILVLYNGSTPLWSSLSNANCASRSCSAVFQSDGNLVVYSGSTAVWNSQTGGNPGAKLVFSDTIPYVTILNSAGGLLTQSLGACDVTDLPSLTQCGSSMLYFQALSFLANVACEGTSCCTGEKGDEALINVTSLNNRSILGNGNILYRWSNNTSCPAISIDGSGTVQVSNLTLDESSGSPSCTFAQATAGQCAATIDVESSNQVSINQVQIYNGKGYVVTVNGTNGFSLSNSVISEAGVIGVYIGTVMENASGTLTENNPSSNISITNSVIARSQTNAIALQGVNASSSYGNVIANNLLTKNHWHGFWPISSTNPGLTTGGQVLFAAASNVNFTNNVEADAICEACTEDPGSSMIELGTGQSDTYMRDQYILIQNNYFYNGSYYLVRENPGSLVLNSYLNNNYVDGLKGLIDPNGPIKFTGQANNVVGDATPSLNWNGAGSEDGNSVYEIVRTAANGYIWESKFQSERSGSTLQGKFVLSPSPRFGGATTPLFRCLNSENISDDYITTNQNCSGEANLRGNFHSIMGYSYEPTYPGAQPFYACVSTNGGDHFVSWDVACEGNYDMGFLGYAVPSPN